MSDTKKRFFILVAEDDEMFPRVIVVDPPTEKVPEVPTPYNDGVLMWVDFAEAVADARERVADSSKSLVVCELVPIRRIVRVTKSTKADGFLLPPSECGLQPIEGEPGLFRDVATGDVINIRDL